MNSGNRIPRFLGAAYLFVLATMILNMVLTQSILSGNISDILTNVSNNLMQLRIGILAELFTSVGIVVLAVLLYAVLNKQNKTIARIALGLWLLEAITLILSKMSTYALIPLSMEYVKTGSADSSYFQTLGNLFIDIGQWGYDVHLFVFSLGAILWYSLFYKSRLIPRILSIWGLVGVSLVLIASVLGWFSYIRPIYLIAPNGLFELVIGLWLVIRGVKPIKINQ